MDGEHDLASAAFGIQRTAGNRALRELIANQSAGRPHAATTSSAPAVQRYTVIPVAKQKKGYWQGENADLRVSDDGAMAVKHHEGTPSGGTNRVFYAKPAVIAASAQALHQAGSPFTIAPGGKTMKGKAPGSALGKTQKLVDAVTTNQDLAKAGKGDRTFQACTGNMLNFLGVFRAPTGDPTKLDQQRKVALKLKGSLDHDKKQVVFNKSLTDAMLAARDIVMGSDGTTHTKAAYQAMEESMRKQVSEQYGIDEYAVPGVGEGFGISSGKSAMGHYAPVVAQSGHDRVTLENDVSQQLEPNSADLGPNWYFRMFGPAKKKEDQSFYGEAIKYENKDYGDRPLVTAIGSVPRDDEKKE